MGADGRVETIEGTTIHPIWSLDRNDWVPLGELEEGEQLLGHAGSATVLSVSIVNLPTAVYNIEVHGEHVYEVGELGILLHNAYSVADALADGVVDAGSTLHKVLVAVESGGTGTSILTSLGKLGKAAESVGLDLGQVISRSDDLLEIQHAGNAVSRILANGEILIFKNGVKVLHLLP